MIGNFVFMFGEENNKKEIGTRLGCVVLSRAFMSPCLTGQNRLFSPFCNSEITTVGPASVVLALLHRLVFISSFITRGSSVFFFCFFSRWLGRKP